MNCPAGVWTSNANYWFARPSDVVLYTTSSAPFTQPAVAATAAVNVGGFAGTTLSAGFTQPAVSATVPITVGSTAGFVSTMRANIVGGGDYTVASVTDATHMVVTNTGLAGNAAPAAAVPSGGAVKPVATAWMSVGQAIWIEHGGDYTVASITGPFAITATNTGTAGVNAAPGAVVATGSAVSPKNTGVTCLRSGTVPDTGSLFSARLTGAGAVGPVEWGQQISGDLAATLRQNCTFSGYFFNATGLTISPKLEIYSCTAFNNFNSIALQTTVDLQTSAGSVWTYVTATVDLSVLSNIANGIWVVVLIPTGLNSASNYVLFSRLKFQIGSIATPFTDDISLFVQTPTIDSTMLQDGCIARPSLFLPNVVPTTAYQDVSVTNPKIADGAIDGRTLATGTAVANLGYTPINKSGDSNIGPGALSFVNDTVVGTPGLNSSAVLIATTTTNQANDGYMPAITFSRPSTFSRAIGLSTTGKFKTVDNSGTVGFLLDTVTKVATADIQDASITYAKLAQAVIDRLVPIGTVHLFAGVAVPGGWFVCDGHDVSRTTYSALFAQLGTYWGVGDNVNTFNLPNLVNKVPVGYGTGALWAFGRTDVGELNHTLTTAEIPSHSHSITDQQHSHSINAHHHGYINPIGTSVGCAPGGQSVTQASGSTNTSDFASTMNASYTNITTTNPSGSGGAHTNMQPSAIMYFIIKAL